MDDVCLSLCFFFFKQKTAYEMRISDWSSDVCSSDLSPLAARIAEAKGIDLEGITGTGPNGRIVRADLGLPPVVAPAPAQTAGTGSAAPIVHDIPDVPHALEKLSNMRRPIARPLTQRSEERRVGKACVSTCRSRWSPYI